ncbi:uncharacterized protein [Pyrus communis]|uniref:uncharacterized protein isoform X2 n=1 Tax=Pyrus communis TaxID=23211 RepID=UPI0035BF455D
MRSLLFCYNTEAEARAEFVCQVQSPVKASSRLNLTGATRMGVEVERMRDTDSKVIQEEGWYCFFFLFECINYMLQVYDGEGLATHALFFRISDCDVKRGYIF